MAENESKTKKRSCSFFRNTDCEYFPCHKNADSNTFNCLFCYCPLYALDVECGGDFTFCSNGVKDCSNCLIPHSENGYDYVLSKLSLVNKKTKIREESNDR